MNFLLVGLGGFCGAIARYLIYLAEQSSGARTFPFGTLFINLLGCFLAGLLMAAAERALPIHRNMILMWSMGVIGSFTTFSTFSVESLQLLRSSQLALAIVSVTANIIFGIGAVWFGRFLIMRS